MQFYLDICVEFLLLNPRVLGGEGLIVEIDEALFARRKYNRGRLIEPQWIFRGYCRTTGLGILIPAPNRTAGTLMPLISDYIAPGAIIYSNGWLLCRQIPEILERHYEHFTVNHNANFVDPETGVNTKGVEGRWSRAKAKVKTMNGTSRSLIYEHAAEFMFKQLHVDQVLGPVHESSVKLTDGWS